MPERRPVAEFFKDLGPGLITGAADDDPSGISTYSVAGASLGLGPLWTALFSFPLMTAVQLMCARLGMVTGRGLAANIRHRFPRWVMWTSCSILLIANIFNIGADIGGMSEAMEMVTHVPAAVWSPVFALALVILVVFASYRLVAKIFKWLTLVLFAYVITAFLTHPDWTHVLRATLIPNFQWSREYFAVLTGILGTTISPYLFFWQASQEVEEERALGRGPEQRKGATDEEIRKSTRDTMAGMFFSNLVMFFIVLTTATTLHAHGLTKIETARQAAEALRPLAGDGAYLLFTLGIVGTGMLAVPVLAGSCAYAVAESARWGASLDRPLRVAPKFYAVLTAAVGLGMFFDFAGFNPVRMLFWSAVLNGILAPPLIVLVLLLTSDPQVMGERANPFVLKALGWLCAVLMTACAVGILVT
ncbi:MAG TPA: Nramp family divalent metal transporter [Bryobacteraceae bacterium]|jgi:NRAMP (natural resistance-associated macrophage protein)-like metal ion transporter|nr:Nramp family divalent metal transporter [Bryobacteraceae bacterium]